MLEAEHTKEGKKCGEKSLAKDAVIFSSRTPEQYP